MRVLVVGLSGLSELSELLDLLVTEVIRVFGLLGWVITENATNMTKRTTEFNRPISSPYANKNVLLGLLG